MERSSEAIKKVRAAIWLLLLLVSVGIVFIWIMMPTNTYRQKWLPEIRAKIDSTTYFGRQGDKLLMFTFPVLFIASLGCVYLHLGKKRVASETNHHRRLAKWSRPVLMKGPLGIVSWTELAFLSMFIALLVWSLSTYLHLSFNEITAQSASEDGEKVWEAKLDSTALFLGVVGNICLAFLFFPVTRGSSVLPLVGLTSEASIKYHILLGHIVMTFFTAHGLCYIIYWASTHQISEMLKWDKVGVSNIAGEVSLLSGLVLWATTFPRIRRKMFELFFYTHHFYILFIIFFILHVGIVYACMMLPCFYLFLVDRYLRFLQSRKSIRLVSARVLSCETVELNFSKSPGMSYTPMSTVFINVPSISKLQWHPFTVTSNSNMDQDKLSVVVKSEGSWTKKLYQMLSCPSPVPHLVVSIEGPYGPASTSFIRHDMVVMVSGGSGITSFISIIRELLFKTKLGFKSPSVLLVCAFKNSSSLAVLDLLLPMSGTLTDISSLQLQIEAYVTREEEPKSDPQKQIRFLCFKPNVTDAPISAILGPNSWLWLGAIISSSFIIFLLFLGLLMRYYIYPIDHNTNNVYSYTPRALLNMLFLCTFIAMTASVAFLWNKKQIALEAKQIQNVDAPTPMTSPYSVSYDAGCDLESLPHQSLVDAAKVHYRKRPNLKKILLECEGSRVGVLVSGPRKLRQEVATICASGLAENLHFGSTSFSW
ncbi:ferric reduction oxidase 2-like [Macadamia integrifolia]|uniref:ferric reduction oxidase 2-like n=1 Tax=Macadamia integrifolia TaxID=60698 RepID=UPI001C4FEC60|nr:ferric reduction oxidase 2-like [Macadamia integrifolia]